MADDKIKVNTNARPEQLAAELVAQKLQQYEASMAVQPEARLATSVRRAPPGRKPLFRS